MRDQNDRLSAPAQLIDAIKAARLKRDITNCQHFIQEKYMVIELCRDGKSEP
jgi:hypothetical protein